MFLAGSKTYRFEAFSEWNPWISMAISSPLSHPKHRLRWSVVCLWHGAALDFGAGKLRTPEWENGLLPETAELVGVSGTGSRRKKNRISWFISNSLWYLLVLWFYSTPLTLHNLHSPLFQTTGNSAAAKMGKATGLVAAKCSRFRCGFDDVVVSKTADTRADAVQIVTCFISVCFFACCDAAYLCCQAPAHPLRIYRVLWAGRFMCIFAVVPVQSRHSFIIAYHGSLPWNGNMYSCYSIQKPIMSRKKGSWTAEWLVFKDF